MTEKLYWHKEMTKEKYDELIRDNATWGDIQDKYRRPDWCNYPEALSGFLGCWGLLNLNRRKIEDCGDCECLVCSKSQCTLKMERPTNGQQGGER